MIAEIDEAERRRDVRRAARAWASAGFLDADRAQNVVASYSDDRVRLGAGFTVLAFVFTSIAIFAAFGFVGVLAGLSTQAGTAILCLFGAAGLAALTEAQRGAGRRLHTGSDNATALWSILFAAVGFTFMAGSSGEASVFFASTFIASAFAAWRWGDSFFHFLLGSALFAWLLQWPHARVAWIIVAAFLIPISLQGARSDRLAPPNRRGFTFICLISVTALYAAIHIYSLDRRFIEFESVSTVGQSSLRPLSALATALMPAALLFAGFRRREPLLIDCGLLLMALSIATIRLYYEVMPISIALLLVGVACLLLAVVVRRWLRAGPKGERHGFTADSLLSNRNKAAAIQAVVSMATFTPAARTPESSPAFKGGGGEFGGGGASGGF